MSRAGSVYGEALYSLAREEGLSQVILRQLDVLDSCFADEPDFLRLLSASNLPKEERCDILDDCFRGRIEDYLLNFLKVLTEKGYIKQFHRCVSTYRALYNQDQGILTVTAITAVPLANRQVQELTKKLHHITGKQIELVSKLDPGILGGIRLDYDGKRLDGTVAHRLEAVRKMLKAGTVWS